MPTNEQYESGAKILSERIRQSDSDVIKMKIISCLGNLRYSQYRATGEEKYKRLAKNCYRAEEKFLVKAIRAYGFDDRLIEQYNWYNYRPKMNEIKKRFARGEKLCKHDLEELEKYEKMIADEEFDRNNDI
jgi:hypothetical protein